MQNVALVVLDTLRKDAFDEHFDWLPGTRFENAWSTSHWTVPAHASLFTGKYGSELGVHAESQRFDCDAPAIAESLSEAGYRTRAFSCNINISKNLSFDRGFDEFEGNWRVESVQGDIFDWDVFISETRDEGPRRYFKGVYECVRGDCDTLPSLKRGLLLKMRDLGIGPKTEDDGVSEAIDYVNSTRFDEGEFLFVNLMEAHTPYDPPDPYKRVPQPEVDGLKAKVGDESYDQEAIRTAYDSCVEYLSDRYQELFEQLREDFDVILTVSDHGEMLGEHGAYEHMYGLYPQLTNVPMAAWSADDTFADGASEDATASILDVHATVAAVADVDVESRGRPLFDLDGDGRFLTEYHGITTVNYNSVVNAGYEDVGYLHDRLSGYVEGDYYGFEDVEEEFIEQGDLPDRDGPPDGREGVDHPDGHGGGDAPDGRERLAALRESVPWRETGDEDLEIDDRTMRHLEDLGYA